MVFGKSSGIRQPTATGASTAIEPQLMILRYAFCGWTASDIPETYKLRTITALTDSSIMPATRRRLG